MIKNIFKLFVKQIVHEILMESNEDYYNKPAELYMNPSRKEFNASFLGDAGIGDTAMGIVNFETGNIYTWVGDVHDHDTVLEDLDTEGIDDKVTIYIYRKPFYVEISPTTRGYYNDRKFSGEELLGIAKKIRANRRLQILIGDNFPIIAYDPIGQFEYFLLKGDEETNKILMQKTPSLKLSK